MEKVTRRPSSPKRKRKKVSGGKDIATKRIRKVSKKPNPPPPPRKRVRRLLCPLHTLESETELELVKQLQGHEGNVKAELEKKGLVMQVL